MKVYATKFREQPNKWGEREIDIFLSVDKAAGLLELLNNIRTEKGLALRLKFGEGKFGPSLSIGSMMNDKSQAGQAQPQQAQGFAPTQAPAQYVQPQAAPTVQSGYPKKPFQVQQPGPAKQWFED